MLFEQTDKVIATSPPERLIKPILKPSLFDANLFLERLKTIDIYTLPNTLQETVGAALVNWTNTDITTIEHSEIKTIYSQAVLLVRNAKKEEDAEIEMGDPPSTETLQMKQRVAQNPPLDFPMIAEYTTEELADKFPKGLEVQAYLGPDIRLLLYQDSPKRYYLIERPGSQKQTLRIIDTPRSFDEINADLQQLPDGLPKIEAIHFQDGKMGVLTDWIDGRSLDSSVPQDNDLLQTSINAIAKAWNQTEGHTAFDYNQTNFKVHREPDGSSRVFYIDSDVPELIFKRGLSTVLNFKN